MSEAILRSAPTRMKLSNLTYHPPSFKSTFLTSGIIRDNIRIHRTKQIHVSCDLERALIVTCIPPIIVTVERWPCSHTAVRCSRCRSITGPNHQPLSVGIAEKPMTCLGTLTFGSVAQAPHLVTVSGAFAVCHFAKLLDRLLDALHQEALLFP
jgi:hypothetical protein